ncbi:hypothetical protein [Deinococcus hohokamensis]|uniref:DUF11 domain-containing protein n=1 Tax=Deinococcus hohokamensis TaxID=309883 RepID=A0ABV9I6B4_9DEIO
MRPLLPLALLAITTLALAGPGQVQLRLDRITTVTTPDGKVTERREQNPKSVRPGQLLEQVAIAQNTGTAAIRDVRITVPVPKNTTFKSGDLSSAVVSIDGGKTYAPTPIKETVTVDGKKVERVVSSNRYTHVRFVIGTISAASAVTRSFRVSVN